MTQPIHSRIQALIEETNHAFEAYGAVNADYAEFAALAIADFKNVLSDQNLTKSKLRSMLRKSMMECKGKDASCWAVFMAEQMSQAANNSGQ